MTVTTWHGPDSMAAGLVPIESVTRFPGNPRRGDVEAIAKSVRRFGQQRRLLIQQSTGFIVSGNHLYDALRLLGWDQVAVDVTDLNDTEARAYLVADNQISARGQNDPAALDAFMRDLYARGGVDDALGFESEQLDRFLVDLQETPSIDETPELPALADLYVKPGDLWRLGPHRLLVGDAMDPANYVRLMAGDAEAAMIWTDPPYGVDYDPQNRDGASQIENDDLKGDALRALLDGAFAAAIAVTRPGGAVYCAAPSSNADVFVGALKALGVYRQTIVWVKDQLVLGRQDFQWRHEAIHFGTTPRRGPFNVKVASNVYYGWRPGAAHWFVTDRTLDTVWEIPRPKRSKEHPTMKPVELIERAILASSRRGDLILDPFVGSGSTVLAAEHAGRVARVIDIDPRYGQVVIERWQTYTGQKAERD